MNEQRMAFLELLSEPKINGLEKKIYYIRSLVMDDMISYEAQMPYSYDFFQMEYSG